jgi:uncharacterized Zn finger protein (UPF0148 family)
MGKTMWVRRCLCCGRPLVKRNKSGFCSNCYIKKPGVKERRRELRIIRSKTK